MGYCVMNGGNTLWVIVWGVVVICYGLCVVNVGKFLGLFCGEWWQFVMGYCVVSGGNLWVIVW